MKFQQLKNIGHYFESRMWQMWYGFPDANMHIYGVTGTNGKTTACYLLASVLEHSYGKEKVGMLTTVSFRVAGVEEINESKMTTLPSRKIFAYLSRMKKVGVQHVVLETTSHALDQYRLANIKLDGAIILNIAREHLDYHHTMQAYASAKEKIVLLLKNNTPLIGKQDDELVRAILDRAEKNGTRVIRMTAQDIEQSTPALMGSINKENAAAVTLLAGAVGIAEEHITTGISSVTTVPGRMEIIHAPQGFTVIIDYAVTPDALERLYADVKKEIVSRPTEKQGKILATLSAAGLRDRGKRPDMARVVAKYASRIIVTREDPWTENEEQIFEDLEKGFPPIALATGGSRLIWQRIVDRKQAIKTLLSEARPGDVVILTGKGAETGMGIGKDIVPWNERGIVEGILKEL